MFLTADIKPDEKLAVMVFIHGGGYSGGSSIAVGPDFLIDQHVILVTLNYRLGVFGFLSLDSPDYSGNMGLKDQQFALKWVHENVDHFSGDNARVTLIGPSAGGASVHFQIFSAESRKYFRNAIPMSGSVDDFWASYGDNDHLAMAYKIAEELGDPKHSFKELVEFLKAVQVDKIAKYSGLNDFSRRTCQTVFSPIVESKMHAL